MTKTQFKTIDLEKHSVDFKMTIVSKLLKILFGIILISVLAYVAFIHFFNLNKYKENINAELTTLIGHKTEIDGELSWLKWPNFGIKVSNLATVNSMHEAILSIDRIDMHVNFMSFIQGKIDVDRLDVYEMDIFLPWPKNSSANQQALKEVKNRKKDERFFHNKIKVDALNLQNIYLHLNGITYHLEKLQALDLNFGKPFPFFAGIHVNRTPQYRRSHQEPMMLYGGKIKGFVTLPRVEDKEHPLRVGEIRGSGDFRAKTIRLLSVYGDKVRGRFSFKNRNFLIDFNFGLGEGLVSGKGKIGMQEPSNIGLDITLEGKNVNLGRVGGELPIIEKGVLDLDINFHSILELPTEKTTIFSESVTPAWSSSGHANINIKDASFHKFNVEDFIHHVGKKIKNNAYQVSKNESYVLKKSDQKVDGDLKINLAFKGGNVLMKKVLFNTPPYLLYATGIYDLDPIKITLKGVLEIDESEKERFPVLFSVIGGEIPLKISTTPEERIIELTVDVETLNKKLNGNGTRELSYEF